MTAVPGPEPARAQQLLEDLPLHRAVEAVQGPAILPHDQLGVKTEAGSVGREALEHTERHPEFISHASISGEHQRLAASRSKDPRYMRDHLRALTGAARIALAEPPLSRRCVSAMATPSAASAGLGAVLSLNSCVTM